MGKQWKLAVTPDEWTLGALEDYLSGINGRSNGNPRSIQDLRKVASQVVLECPYDIDPTNAGEYRKLKMNEWYEVTAKVQQAFADAFQSGNQGTNSDASDVQQADAPDDSGLDDES